MWLCRVEDLLTSPVVEVQPGVAGKFPTHWNPVRAGLTGADRGLDDGPLGYASRSRVLVDEGLYIGLDVYLNPNSGGAALAAHRTGHASTVERNL